MAKPVIAIVGRPNVGKSTIFNRIVGERVSIVEDIPGVTRDRIYGTGEWKGRVFSLIDTGGIVREEEDELARLVCMQAELAIEEADVIVFMVDAKTGITQPDRDVAEMLYRARKPVVVAVNKVDNPKQIANIYEFYDLGFGEPIAVSGAHGTGIGDLLDAAVALLPEGEDDTYDEDVIKVAVIGRP